jgi:hypothetical protein
MENKIHVPNHNQSPSIEGHLDPIQVFSVLSVPPRHSVEKNLVITGRGKCLPRHSGGKKMVLSKMGKTNIDQYSTRLPGKKSKH